MTDNRNLLLKALQVPFLRFLVTGGLAAGVNILSRHLLSFWLPFEAAIVVAYLIAMTTAYLLARALVFPPSGRTRQSEYVRFALVNLAALVQVWIVSVGLADWLLPSVGWGYRPELVAHTVGVLSPAVTSYYGHKAYTFRNEIGRE